MNCWSAARQAVIVIPALLVVGCATRSNHVRLAPDQVQLIEVTRYADVPDEADPRGAAGARPQQLDEARTRTFVDRWNGAREVEMWKYRPRCLVRVHLIDGQTRAFRVAGAHVKDAAFGDRTFLVAPPDDLCDAVVPSTDAGAGP